MRLTTMSRCARMVTKTWGPRNRINPRTSSARPIAMLHRCRERRAVEAKAAADASGVPRGRSGRGVAWFDPARQPGKLAAMTAAPKFIREPEREIPVRGEYD